MHHAHKQSQVNMAAAVSHIQKDTVGVKRKEIYRYNAPWTIYGMNWSLRHNERFRLAIGSFIEDYCNKVQSRVKLVIYNSEPCLVYIYIKTAT